MNDNTLDKAEDIRIPVLGGVPLLFALLSAVAEAEHAEVLTAPQVTAFLTSMMMHYMQVVDGKTDLHIHANDMKVVVDLVAQAIEKEAAVKDTPVTATGDLANMKPQGRA